MHRHTLPALLAAALWIPALTPAQAQAPPAKPPVGAKQPAPTTPPRLTAGTDVVGSAFDKKITWDDLIARMRKDNSQAFSQVVAQAAGPKVADALFGPTPGKSITLTQDDVYASIRQTPPPVIVQVLEQILQQEAFSHEAAAQNLVVTDSMVSDKINKILQGLRKQGRIPANVTDDQFLESQRTTRAQVLANYRPILTAMMLIGKDIEKNTGHPVGPGDFVQVRQILIKAPAPSQKPTAADKKADTDAVEKATRVLKEINSGKKTFDQAAKQYSEDPANKMRGGDMGVIMRGSQLPEIEATAFKLKVNEISQPIHTMNGYYILQVTKLGKDIPQDQRDELLDNRERQMYQGYIAGLRQRANITDNLRPATPAFPPGVSAPGRPN